MTRFRCSLLLLATSTCLVAPALAAKPHAAPKAAATQNDAPVSFTADSLTYDKTTHLITATGHVTAIQNGHLLRADKVVINRLTNVVVASGHVSLTQSGGETIYTNHAVLSDNMKDAVMQMVAAQLGDNVRMISNGGRRYNNAVDELTKPVYSACDLCKKDPYAPPTWTIRASSATHDLQHKMIEFRNASLLFHGVPVFWLPYLSEPAPSVKRQSGLLIPSVGSTSELGPFFVLPYYFTLGPSADLVLAPVLAVKEGPAVKANYRQAFNRGALDIKLSGGRDRDKWGNSVFSSANFDINDYWRVGGSYNHASNPQYLNDFSILPNVSYLQSNVYLEGFSQGSYTSLSADTYQGLVASVDQSKLPVVAPYGQYHFVSQPDPWLGGTFKVDTSFFNVMRHIGTNTRRVAFIPSYSVPFTLPVGVVGTARVQLDTAYYNADKLDQQPNDSLDSQQASTFRAQPYGAVMLRWPVIRATSQGGSQLIEPIVQVVGSPNVGISRNDDIPNEDSLDLEFSDSNLFALNRYPGIDRLDGGERVDYALHSAWYMADGMIVDGLIGQSYRFHKDMDYIPASGLEDNASDIVGHATVAPTPWFNVVYRGRFSHTTMGNRMSDISTNFGTHTLSVSTGYLYSDVNPYALYDNEVQGQIVNLNPPDAYFHPRREVTTNLSTHWQGWSLSGGMQRNLESHRFDEANASLGWQNDCFGLNMIFYKRFTSFNLDNGSTMVLLQLNFKTLGTVGFNAL